MDKILENIKASYSENRKPSQLDKLCFYSNLSVTKDFQKKTEIHLKILNGIEFLNKTIRATGFQSSVIPNSSESVSKTPKFPLEIYTSLLALDTLRELEDDFEDEGEISWKIRRIVKYLICFILPDSGISTFNIFKNNNSTIPCNETDFIRACSSTSINSSELSSGIFSEESPSISPDLKDVENIENVPYIIDFPDDCNTTALALSILLREGILGIKPTASVAQILLSNTGNDSPISNNPGVIRAFCKEIDAIDATACANVLYLYYILTEELDEEDVSYATLPLFRENVESTQTFLCELLNNLLTDNSSPFLSMHSTDSFLYFLSRCAGISERAKALFEQSLVSLLDKIVSKDAQHDGPLSISMRILCAYELGLLRPEGNWLKRKLQEQVCQLIQMQNQDGSWPIDYTLYKVCVEENDFFFGSREISTVFACRALQVYNESEKYAKISEKLYNDVLY